MMRHSLSLKLCVTGPAIGTWLTLVGASVMFAAGAGGSTVGPHVGILDPGSPALGAPASGSGSGAGSGSGSGSGAASGSGSGGGDPQQPCIPSAWANKTSSERCSHLFDPSLGVDTYDRFLDLDNLLGPQTERYWCERPPDCELQAFYCSEDRAVWWVSVLFSNAWNYGKTQRRRVYLRDQSKWWFGLLVFQVAASVGRVTLAVARVWYSWFAVGACLDECPNPETRTPKAAMAWMVVRDGAALLIVLYSVVQLLELEEMDTYHRTAAGGKRMSIRDLTMAHKLRWCGAGFFRCVYYPLLGCALVPLVLMQLASFWTVFPMIGTAAASFFLIMLVLYLANLAGAITRWLTTAIREGCGKSCSGCCERGGCDDEEVDWERDCCCIPLSGGWSGKNDAAQGALLVFSALMAWLAVVGASFECWAYAGEGWVVSRPTAVPVQCTTVPPVCSTACWYSAYVCALCARVVLASPCHRGGRHTL